MVALDVAKNQRRSTMRESQRTRLGASADHRPAGSRATIVGPSPGAQGEYTAP